MKNLKWLHLSDFHIGKDNYGQIKLFRYILQHIKENKQKGFVPDAIFITGDIANKGISDQYHVFSEEFLLPLIDEYGDLSKVYIVPGNHDVDRNRCTLAAKSLYDVLTAKQQNFFDPNKEGFDCRREILDRFSAFYESEIAEMCFSPKEIFEEKGFFTDILIKEDKKVGIIGINTAWLSNSDEDKEKLSPGKYMLEEALNQVEDCDYKIVLGHHPLSWFQSDQRQQIFTLFAKYNAMYLHGHMHKNSGEYSMALNTGFLNLQCGAAFQAREDEKYYNSIQWGELDFEKNAVRIIPKRWSVTNQGFVPDISGRMPESFREEGKDSFLFPYTFTVTVNQKKENSDAQVKAPPGWHHINQEFIQARNEPSQEEILKYFDGREPSYKEIFSSYIPVRGIVEKIGKEFVRSNEENETKCVLITGAGGEGKTTVLLQTVRMLVEENNWNALVLRQSEKGMQINEQQMSDITKEGNWIICVDNSAPIAIQFFDLLKRFAMREHRHVHLLLCARDTDWNNNECSKLQWRDYSNYSTYKLRGINEEDAGKIVTAWEKLGEKGLGKLKGMDLSVAKEKLVSFSKREEEKNDPDEGALLGAMLTTRYGDDLHDHIREMLLRLQALPLGNETLLEAFAYIVAMHTERLYFLSKTVMAKMYNYELRNVKKKILGPLGDEAASAVSGDIIFTRHISIAKVARKIMDEEFHIDFDELFIDLAVAAVSAGKSGEFVESLGSWRYLSDHFKKKNQTLAVRLDEKVLSIDPYNAYMIVHLSKLYRAASQPEKALILFREVHYPIDHRSFFCEWALVEANQGNKATSVCLSALGLSDQAEKKTINVKDSCINLYSIALTFLELHKQFKNEQYYTAALAAIRLGERINENDENIKELIKSNRGKYENVEYKCLQRGILLAEEEKELTFKNWIPKIKNLEYKGLFLRADIVL